MTIKPCAHCGSDRVTVWNVVAGQQAVCKDCKTTGPIVAVADIPDGPERARDEAVAAWNAQAARLPETVQ